MPEFGEIFDSKKQGQSKYRKSSQRIFVKPDFSTSNAALTGRIVEVVGKNYLVKSGDVEAQITECTPAGTIASPHGQASLIAVGDYVKFDINSKNSIGKITSVIERKTWLSRKPLIGIREDIIAANSEYLLVIMSAENPRYNKRLIDRLLIAGKIGNMKPALLINKIDLSDIDLLREDMKVYSKLDLKIFYTCAKNGQGFEELIEFIQDKGLLLIGPSGVGKSTIINKLAGETIQTTREVSNKTSKGKHTTSSAKIIYLKDDITIIDSPGIREFGIVNITKEELSLYFDEFYEFYENCRFMPCTHTHEPGCEIKSAVESGRIDFERYESYLNIFSTLE